MVKQKNTQFYWVGPNQIMLEPMMLLFIQPFDHQPTTEKQTFQNHNLPQFSGSLKQNQQINWATGGSNQFHAGNYDNRSKNENQQKVNTKIYKQKKNKFKDLEQQFRPNKTKQKKTYRIAQNSNRNIIPNIMHQVISFLQKKNKSQQVVQKIIAKLKADTYCSPKRFYLYQMLVKQKLTHYVNAQSLLIFKQIQQPRCQLYRQQQQRIYNKISRILICYYLKQEFTPAILTSKRVNENKILEHLETKRVLLQQIMGILCF